VNIINLTPNTISLPGGREIEPSGFVARVNSHMTQVGEVDGIPLLKSHYHSTMNLPDPSKEIMYIVSSIVRQHHPERNDLMSPAKLIRDPRGVIIGCGAFETNA
jgi:hypothetical protein